MKGESISKGKSRWYPCPKCGDQHPSVTTLLDVIGSQALMGWMAKNGTAKLKVFSDVVQANVADSEFGNMQKLAENRWKLTEDTAFWKSGKDTGKEAADYGTLAHSWIEAHLHGKEVTLESLPEPSRNAVNAMLTWEKEHHLETIKTEETFYNCRLNYAGTCDWIGKLDGELSLGDWKTSTGIFFNFVIQTWAYVLANETQSADRLYKQIFIARFGKDGSSEVKIFKRNEFPSIETAREVITACGSIFKATQMWDKLNPYRPKPKEKQNEIPAKTS